MSEASLGGGTENALPEVPVSAEAPPKPPSRLGGFFRSSLRWIVAIVLVFALGVGAAWILQIRPQAQEIQRLQGELSAAQTELETVRADLQSAETENEDLRAEVQDLREWEARATKELLVLDSLIDVTGAQLAMASDDVEAARSILSDLDTRLQSLEDAVSGADVAKVRAMRDRLELIQSELARNPFAARSDLEVLANDLNALRQVLTTE